MKVWSAGVVPASSTPLAALAQACRHVRRIRRRLPNHLRSLLPPRLHDAVLAKWRGSDSRRCKAANACARGQTDAIRWFRPRDREEVQPFRHNAELSYIAGK